MEPIYLIIEHTLTIDIDVKSTVRFVDKGKEENKRIFGFLLQKSDNFETKNKSNKSVAVDAVITNVVVFISYVAHITGDHLFSTIAHARATIRSNKSAKINRKLSVHLIE